MTLIACANVKNTATKPIQSRLVHIVFVWLKEPGNEEHIKQIIVETEKLKAISKIQALRVGKSISSNRNIVDDSFDVGITMMFDNKDDMERYLKHPKHKHVVKTVLQPLASKVLVYDFL
ncbi:MAG: Dabb family protein [Gammaproteobacteria bacterium]